MLESHWFWNVPMISLSDSFITMLHTHGGKCNFAESEQMIQDKIIFFAEKRLQKKLLRDNQLIFAKAISICKTFEQTQIQILEMNPQMDKAKINDIRKQR